MLKNARLMALLACAGLAGAAMAQDSVSPTQGLPNTDAVGALSTTEQCNQFVADLTEIRSTLDLPWGITPMFKLSRVNASFPTGQNSSAVISRTSIARTNPAFGSYLAWNAAGPGVNGLINSPTTAIPVTGSSFQLGVAFTEFSGWGAAFNPSYNGVIGGIVNYQAGNPNRLYVSRTSAAVNSAAPNEDRSQFGIGACDATGNIYFRADCGGNPTCTSTGPNVLNSVNEFRVDQLVRNCQLLNVIDNTGADDAAASDWVVELQPQAGNFNCPSMIPEEVAGRPILMACNFNREYVWENVASNFAVTTTHRPGTTDHRGNLGYSQANFFSGSVNGTAGVLSKPNGAASPDTDGLSLFGLGNNGQVSGTRLISLPASITDGCQSSYTYTVTNADEFQHYRSTVGFRGGSNVGLGMDAQNRLLVTAYASSGASNDWPLGYIAGARLDTPTAVPQWGLVAWVDIDLSSELTIGKPFFDETGAQVGRLTTLLEVTGGSPLGPSMSAGAVDAAGNVWFLSAFVSTDAKGVPIPDSANTGLFRAVYDGSNPAGPSWCLELVMRNGQQIVGANSTREYKIIFLSIASSSAVASSTLWANDVVQTPWAGATGTRAEPIDPRNMGGLVLNASLIYDVNQDGDFVSLTGAQGNPASPDQNYNVVLFLAPFTEGGGKITDCNENGVDDAADIAAGTSKDCFDFAAAAGTAGGPNGIPDECECVADWNRDGTSNSTDVSDFINTFFADQAGGGSDGDVNCDGVSNSTDVSDFINVWFAAQAGQLPFAGCTI